MNLDEARRRAPSYLSDMAAKRGEVSANNAMRHLRSVYNFTAATQDDFPPNQVLILTQARAWYKSLY